MTSQVTSDDELLRCSQTELLQIARRQGLPPLRRSLSKERIVEIVTGNDIFRPEEVAGTINSRVALQQYITKHWGVVRSQLPGCDGKCTTYPCSEGRHAMCFSPNAEHILADSRGHTR